MWLGGSDSCWYGGCGRVQVDMGDAFVDAWSVANKVSDLLLERMGREVSSRPHDGPLSSMDQWKRLCDSQSADPLLDL